MSTKIVKYLIVANFQLIILFVCNIFRFIDKVKAYNTTKIFLGELGGICSLNTQSPSRGTSQIQKKIPVLRIRQGLTKT